MMETQLPYLKLSQQQRVLDSVLAEKNQRLSKIYLGILVVLNDPGNPDQLALAAHGVRELMEKMPEFLDLQIKAHTEGLKEKVRNLEICWQSTLKHTKCYNSQTWNGEIDAPILKLFKKLQGFFEWFDGHHPRRKAEITSTLRRLDKSGRILPQPLEELNVKAWDEMRDFFQAVAHHRKLATIDEFSQWLDALERFLLDRLRPRTFVDFEAIDKLIIEGDSDA